MINSTHFSQRIQKIMKHYDLNASSFAEKIQVGRSSISHILSGRNKPSLDFVLNIVNTFPEVDLYWLVNGDGTFPNSNDPKTIVEKKPSTTPVIAQEVSTTNSQKIKKDTSIDLFSDQKQNTTPSTNKSIEGKKVTKIIVLYSDGTFKDYLPE